MVKHRKNHYMITPMILTVIALSLAIIIQSIHATPVSDTTKQQPILSIISTREVPSFNVTQLTKLVDYTIAKFKGSPCPTEIAIFVHGFNKDKDDAGEEFNRLQTSLNNNNYTIPLIGFSWDSKVPWPQAKINAKNSGEELAKFIFGFKKESKCPNTNIHIIAHSLGAAVVENALDNLDFYLESKLSNSNSKLIKSVHLLGAAINNQLIGNNTLLGNATENIVDKFYNLYSSEDDGLEINRFYEKHNPLGLVGSPNGTVHSNYIDKNVTLDLSPFSDADGDGNLEECFEEYKPALIKGDNHCGYIGFRQPFSASLIDDGVMNIVVANWNER